MKIFNNHLFILTIICLSLWGFAIVHADLIEDPNYFEFYNSVYNIRNIDQKTPHYDRYYDSCKLNRSKKYIHCYDYFKKADHYIGIPIKSIKDPNNIIRKGTYCFMPELYHHVDGVGTNEDFSFALAKPNEEFKTDQTYYYLYYNESDKTYKKAENFFVFRCNNLNDNKEGDFAVYYDKVYIIKK